METKSFSRKYMLKVSQQNKFSRWKMADVLSLFFFFCSFSFERRPMANVYFIVLLSLFPFLFFLIPEYNNSDANIWTMHKKFFSLLCKPGFEDWKMEFPSFEVFFSRLRSIGESGDETKIEKRRGRDGKRQIGTERERIDSVPVFIDWNMYKPDLVNTERHDFCCIHNLIVYW